jgi:hypothetical protein
MPSKSPFIIDLNSDIIQQAKKRIQQQEQQPLIPKP